MTLEGLRTLLGVVLWLAATLSAPFVVLLWLQVGGVLVLVAAFLSLLVFACALLATHLNQSLDDIEWLESDTSDELFEHEEVEEEVECSGLRILRIGKKSPLRGHISERAIILAINGVSPATAEEANQALVEGVNEIEWMGRNGKRLVARISTHGNEHDLLAQFEQLNPRPKSAVASAGSGAGQAIT